MKPYHLLSYMALADEQYVDEASDLAVARYRRRRTRTRWIVAASLALAVLTGVLLAEPAQYAWEMRNTVTSWDHSLLGGSSKPSSPMFVSAEMPAQRKLDADQPFTLSVGMGQTSDHTHATLTVNAPGFEITDKDGHTATDRYVRILADFNSGEYGMLRDAEDRGRFTKCSYREDFSFRYVGEASEGQGTITLRLTTLGNGWSDGTAVFLYYTLEDGVLKLTDERPADGGQHAVLEEENSVEISYADYHVKVSVTDPVLCRGESLWDKIDIDINWNGESFGQSIMISEFLIELWPKGPEGSVIRLMTPALSSMAPSGMIPVQASLGAYDLVVTWYGDGMEGPRWVFEDFVEIVEAPEGADLLTKEELSVSVHMETELLTPGMRMTKPEIEARVLATGEKYDTSRFTAELVLAETLREEDYSFLVRKPPEITENGGMIALVPRVPTDAPVGTYDLRITDLETGFVWVFENQAVVVPPALHPDGHLYPAYEDLICEATAAKTYLRQGEYFVGEDFDVFDISVMHKNGEDQTIWCSAELVCTLPSDGRDGYSFTIRTSALSSSGNPPYVPVDASPGYYDLVVRDTLHGYTWRFENFIAVVADPSAGVGG